MIFVHRSGPTTGTIVPPMLIRIGAPLLVLAALPIAIVVFAAALGAAASIAAILKLRAALSGTDRRAPPGNVIETDYVVLSEAPAQDRKPRHPH